jgi:hypothetical protein
MNENGRPASLRGRGDRVRACLLGESMPQADTHQRTEGPVVRRRKRIPPLVILTPVPGASCGGIRDCSGPTDRVFVGDRGPSDSVSATSGRVACSSSDAPTSGARLNQRGDAVSVVDAGAACSLETPQVMGIPGLISRCGLETTATVGAAFRGFMPTPRTTWIRLRSDGGKVPSGAAKSTANPCTPRSRTRLRAILE